MSAVPTFTSVPVIGEVPISTPNANRDGATGTYYDILTGSTNGTRLKRVTIQAIATTTAGMVRLYISDGTNRRLWQEVPVAAITPSGTVQAFRAVLSDLQIDLPSSYKLCASTHNGETFNVIAEGANY